MIPKEMPGTLPESWQEQIMLGMSGELPRDQPARPVAALAELETSQGTIEICR